jgi:hypothetical protein
MKNAERAARRQVAGAAQSAFSAQSYNDAASHLLGTFSRQPVCDDI